MKAASVRINTYIGPTDGCLYHAIEKLEVHERAAVLKRLAVIGALVERGLLAPALAAHIPATGLKGCKANAPDIGKNTGVAITQGTLDSSAQEYGQALEDAAALGQALGDDDLLMDLF